MKKLTPTQQRLIIIKEEKTFATEAKGESRYHQGECEKAKGAGNRILAGYHCSEAAIDTSWVGKRLRIAGNEERKL
jgi:hypothetical protein